MSEDSKPQIVHTSSPSPTKPTTPKKRKAPSNMESPSTKKAKNGEVDKAELVEAVFDYARQNGVDHFVRKVSWEIGHIQMVELMGSFADS